MTDPADISVDEIVTEDQLTDFREEIEETVENALSDADGHDHDSLEDVLADTGYVDADAAKDVADSTFIERMRHLAYDECDTEECNRLRDAIGVDPSESGHNRFEGSEDARDGSNSQRSQSPLQRREIEPEREGDESETETSVFGEPV